MADLGTVTTVRDTTTGLEPAVVDCWETLLEVDDVLVSEVVPCGATFVADDVFTPDDVTADDVKTDGVIGNDVITLEEDNVVGVVDVMDIGFAVVTGAGGLLVTGAVRRAVLYCMAD